MRGVLPVGVRFSLVLVLCMQQASCCGRIASKWRCVGLWVQVDAQSEILCEPSLSSSTMKITMKIYQQPDADFEVRLLPNCEPYLAQLCPRSTPRLQTLSPLSKPRSMKLKAMISQSKISSFVVRSSLSSFPDILTSAHRIQPESFLTIGPWNRTESTRRPGWSS